MTRTNAVILVSITTLVALTLSYPAAAQPPGGDDDLRELIVLLAPESRGAPSPEAVVESVNAGNGLILGGLVAGNPERARLAITRRAQGRLLERIVADPDSDEARLQRYVVLTFPPEVDLDGVLTGLEQARHVDFVEKNKRLRLHAPLPEDMLLGTPASDPDDGQWGLHLLRFPEAACLGDGGHGYVAVLDTGLQTTHEDLALRGTDVSGNPTVGPFREHMSIDLQFNNCGVDELDPDDGVPRQFAGHGTHVSGTVAARTGDGGETVVGACYHCSIEMIRVGVTITTDRVANALNRTRKDGVQVVNMSFGFDESPCAVGDPRALCASLRSTADRDIVLVASAGNDLGPIELPAKDATVISVGGLEWAGTVDGRPTAAFWDEQPQCPRSGTEECGSNFGPEQDLAAPARDVISTMYVGFDHNPEFECGDKFLAVNGYGPCRGTSMAAPHVTALVAVVRSINPWLSREAVYAIITATASQAGNRTDQLGYGVPNAEAATLLALGQAGGQPLTNRLTAYFSFFGQSANPDPVSNPDFRKAETHLYTTVPSTASAWVLEVDDPIDSIGPAVPGYPEFPDASCRISPCTGLPRAALYVFTTDKEPFPGAPPLVPLFRLRYDPDVFADCNPDVILVPHRDFAYTTTIAGVEYFKDNVVDANDVGYDLDGIEGYIFESCDGEPGCTPPPGTVRVYRMFHPERHDYAIFPETELAAMVAQGYQEQIRLATVLGYAYPNVDLDGDALIDGWEDLIGTHPAVADSDCDGVSDGDEVLLFDLTQKRYGDPLLGPCGVAIFIDGFESGDLSRWSGVGP